VTSNKPFRLKAAVSALALVGGLVGLQQHAQAAATIIINNVNAAGVGFNDTTPATPVGGNTGTTLGQQRLIAFTYAANLWGATLTSSQPIIINAQFSALSCTSTSATLGSAGATSTFRNFPNAPKANTLYSYALANKLAGSYLGTANAAQISANFNVNLGKTGCLDGSPFYLGLDGNEGTLIDFVAVLEHEMGHGIGFQTFTNGSTGAQSGGFPSIWDWYLMGTATGKLWKDMTNAERAASAISVNGLVWTGPLVTAAVPTVLRQGLPTVTVSGANAGATAGAHSAGEASFGALLSTVPVSGQLMPVVDQADGTGLACSPLSAANATAVRNNIALIDRGTCNFAVKAKNAQDAGAIGVIIANNAAGVAPGLGGSDATVVIPTVSITQADGVALKAQLAKRSRTTSGVVAALGITGTQYAGADPQGRALLYAPNPFVSGSSVSHFDISMFPNQLMEPNINGDLTQSVVPPQDMTFPLLRDIGW
jgi:hypothetical protein